LSRRWYNFGSLSWYSCHILSVVLDEMADKPLGLVLECVGSGPVLVSGVIELESSGALSRRSLFDSCRSAISWRLLWERKVSNCFKPLSCAGGEGKDVPEASGKHSML
jgi:hypothetical protein